MRCLYVNCGGESLGEVAVHLIHRIGAESLYRLIAVVPVPEEDMKIIAWDTPPQTPLPDLVLEDVIAGETSVVVQFTGLSEILEAIAKIEAEPHIHPAVV